MVPAWVKGSGAGRPWAALGAGRVCGAGGPESWVQAGGMTVVGVPRTRSAARPVLAMRPQQAPVSGKVFIQRDYSSGTRCQFQTKFPPELDSRVRMSFPEFGTQTMMELRGLLEYLSFSRIKIV